MCVDRVSLFSGGNREVSVLGWCWSRKHKVAGLSLLAGRERTACLWGMERTDVAAHLSDPRAHKAGFVGRVRVSKGCPSIQLTGTIDGKPEIFADIAVPNASPGTADGIGTYSDWLRWCEPQLFWPEQEVLTRLRTLRDSPEISIVLPTYDTPRYYLERCIQSVLCQHYPFWQLCIADDGSTDSDTTSYLRQIAAQDARITVEFRPRCGGISAASNTAVRLALGDYIVLLDHDDELHPAALVEIARRLNNSADADLIYSDEDKIDNEGRRFAPSFKPSFDTGLISAFNYIGHLVCIRRILVEKVGGFRPECDGSQDWDLLLRVIEQIRPEHIQHIHKPLYHWRSHPGSTAMSLAAKPHVHRAWRRVLNDHAARTGKPARVEEGLFTGSMRLRPHPSHASVAVVYRSRDGVHQRNAVQRTGYSNLKLYEMILTRIYPAKDRSSNPLLTLSELEGDVVVVLNAPVESLNHQFFDEMVSCAERLDCGIAGALIVGTDGCIRNAGLYYRSDRTLMNPFAGLNYAALGYMGLAKTTRAVAGIGAQCFAVRRSRLHSIGGLAALAEDTLARVCWKLIASAHEEGLKVVYTPYAVVSVKPEADNEPFANVGKVPDDLRINPNIEAFASPADFFRRGHVVD